MKFGIIKNYSRHPFITNGRWSYYLAVHSDEKQPRVKYTLPEEISSGYS